jgi:ubiquinone/menaquinone biosynthesis C-methylase UbiE
MNRAMHQKSEAVRKQWEVAADGWDAHSPALQAWLSGPTRTMFEAAGISAGYDVLDVAAGAGNQTLALVERLGPRGHVLATDISPKLVERLRLNTERAGTSTVEVRAVDAQLPLAETDAFDAAICRLGLMLMPEPARCLAAVQAALKPGGRFSALVFAGPEENPCIKISMATAMRHAGLPARDPYAPGGLLSLGRPGHLQRLFEEAGFREVSTFRIEAPFALPSVDDYIAFLRAAAAPVMALLTRLAPEAQEAAWQDLRHQLSVFRTPTEWVGLNTLLLATGRKR